MGNMHCPAEDAAHLATVARDFCPFPDYSPGPLFVNMLSVNSSRHLTEHYSAVQASLTAQQQQAFTQTLRNTFGKEGKVSYGGVGVVALSLAVLFDSVARQVKGQYESYQEPIPGLFLKDPRGYYAPDVYTVSKYLRLVPYIANNPARMRDETQKYLRELKAATPPAGVNSTVPTHEEITEVNMWKCQMVEKSMKLHFKRISNETLDLGDSDKPSTTEEGPNKKFILNLNCDSKVASEKFLAELDSFDDRTKEAFKSCKPNSDSHMYDTVMENIALLNLIDVITIPLYMSRFEYRYLLAQKHDFDLKVNALGKWNMD